LRFKGQGGTVAGVNETNRFAFSSPPSISREVRMSLATPPDPRRWWTLGVLCLSLLVIGVDNTILNVALPTLERDLGASASQLQWIVDAYMLVFAGLLLTAGALGDRFGRKRALEIGLVVFAAGSVWAALAASAESLIAARALMGVGGAFIMPSTLSILTATFPAGERGRAIGIWAAVAGLGIVIGPLSGGWLLEHASWHAVFLVNLPFVLATFVAGRWLVRESRDPDAGRLDVRGFALSFTGLTALVWAIIEAPGTGWTDPSILAAFGLAAIALALFAAWELRAPAPMLDVRLFRNRRFSAASAAIALTFFALFGTIFFLTQYLQLVLGHSALEAGVRVMPVAAGMIVGGPLSARLAERAGTKLVVAGGLGLVAAGLAILALAEVDSSYTVIAASMAILGLGMGLAMAPATDSIMGALPLAKASVGSAVNDATRTTGGALGVAVLGSLLSSHYRGAMESVTTGLPGAAAEAARDSLSGALAVSGRVGGDAGAQIAEAAQSAFVSGMHVAVLVAAGIAVAGAVVALVALPAREAETPAQPRAADLAPEALAA
jgi:EmrB/QacA subfamily drug resistance transporter